MTATNVYTNTYRLMALSMPDSLAREITNQLNLFSLPSVLSATDAEPATPFEGDAYIVPAGGAGWGNTNGAQLALFDGEQFIFLTPRLFTTVYVVDVADYQQYNGSAWVSSFPGLAAIATSGSASDLVAGTVPAARLPFPSATTLGAVESLLPTSHLFLTGISTTGVPTTAQPAVSDISGAGALASLGVGTGLTSGGGNLSVTYGTTTGTAAQGNDPRFANNLQYGTVTAKATTYSVQLTDSIIECNASSGAFTITYPINLAVGKPVIICRSPADTTSNQISISDGANVVAIIALPNSGGFPQILQSFTVYSNGSALRVT